MFVSPALILLPDPVCDTHYNEDIKNFNITQYTNMLAKHLQYRLQKLELKFKKQTINSYILPPSVKLCKLYTELKLQLTISYL